MAQGYGFPYVFVTSKTYAQIRAAGLSGLLDEIATQQAATADPTAAPTHAATGGGSTGGLLAAGTYYLVFTESNGLGETAKSPESAQLTVSAGNIPRVTFPALKTNNGSRHLYAGAVNGPSGGPYKRYASYITSATHDMATAVLTTSDAVSPPTANGTAPDRKAIELLRLARNGKLNLVYRYIQDASNNYHTGSAADWRDTMLELQRAHWVIRAMERSCAVMGEAWRANPGTLGFETYGLGQQRKVRTFP
jgi:hypothetical protein